MNGERKRWSLNGNADVKYCDKLENGLGEVSAIKQPPTKPRHPPIHAQSISERRATCVGTRRELEIESN